MKTKRKNPQAKELTYEQVESRKERGVEGLRRLGEESRAETLDDESVEDFAERKKITIVNPRPRAKNFLGFGGGRKVVSKEEAKDLQQDAARSHCNKGEYKMALKVSKQSPGRFARQRGMKIEGVVGRAKKRIKKKVATKALGWLQENPRRRRNGEIEDAQAMFQRFHGRRPTTIEEIRQRQEYRSTLSGLGVLMFLRTDLTQEWNGKGVGLTFSEEDKVIVASDPDGNQIYFLGGNQDVSGILPKNYVDRRKDFIDLGACDCIIYTADKVFDNFEDKDYQHEFAEDGMKDNRVDLEKTWRRLRPRLMFDCLNQQLYLIGGAYEVRPEGIVN